MAAESSEVPLEPRSAMRAEDWVKVWEKRFKHDRSHVADHGEGHKKQHCHETEADVDEKGNQLCVDKYLKSNLEHLTDGRTDKSILVSLCGNSPDMEWLSSKGYDVVGVEISEIGVRSAFEKSHINSASPIPFEVTVDGSLKIYSATDGKKMKVYVANFFDDALTPEKIGTFDCIWDSHGIISVPVPQQEAYALKLITFLKPGGKMMYSTAAYDYVKPKDEHHPSPLSMSDLQKFYPEHTARILENTPVDGAEGWSEQIVLIL